jgi:hypothetical protein
MVLIACLKNGSVMGRRAPTGGSASFAGCSRARFTRAILVSEHIFRNSHKFPLIRVPFGRLYEGSPEGSGAGPGEPNSWLTRKWIPAPPLRQGVRHHQSHPMCPTSSGQRRADALGIAVSRRQDADLTLPADLAREWALDEHTGAPRRSVTLRIRGRGRPSYGIENLATVGAEKEGTDR